METEDCVMAEYAESTYLERVRYFPRQLITADDMRQEQDYFREKLRRHNRLIHGWGIVCGLVVTAAPSQVPWNVMICPGYALGPYGDEIHVPQAVDFDLAGCLSRGKLGPCEVTTAVTKAAESLYVAIKYAECLTHPVRTLPAGCGCDEAACEYSRIRDSFEITCLSELPASHSLKVIKGQCPPCPNNPWLVLAKVTNVGTGTLTDANINNDVRRIVAS